MTDVEKALTHDQNSIRNTDVSVTKSLENASDPFAPPPHIDPTLIFSARRHHTSCYTIDTTVQPVLFTIRQRSENLEQDVDGNIITGIDRKSRFRLNIAFVIDRSGSMEGHALDCVKQACTDFFDLVDSRDFISVISFADNAEIVLPARHITNKTLAKDNINKLKTGNTTNLYQGLILACQQLSAVNDSTTLNRIILVTDGVPSVGLKDFSAIIGKVTEQKTRDISVTAIGLGDDYGSELLIGLAERTGGNYYHVPNADSLTDIFKAEFDSLANVVARDLRLRVHLTRGVDIRQAYGHKPIYGNRMVDVFLSNVERGKLINSLWELEIATHMPGRYRVAKAELSYMDLITGHPEMHTVDIMYDFAAEPVAEEAGELSEIIEVAEAVRSLDKTVLAVRRQGLDTAAVLEELERVKGIVTKHGYNEYVDAITRASTDIQAGGSVEKILLSTVFYLDQGKAH